MAGWHRSWDETSRHVPVKPLSVREGTAGRGSDTIRAVVAPAEREGTNLNLGILPCLDFGPEEGKPDLPSRDDVARELEAFLNLNGEMAAWPENHPRVISELFDGEAKWEEVESSVESKDSHRTFPRLTASPPPSPGKRHEATRGPNRLNPSECPLCNTRYLKCPKLGTPQPPLGVRQRPGELVATMGPTVKTRGGRGGTFPAPVEALGIAPQGPPPSNRP